MNKITKLFLAGFLITGTAACNDDFLEEKPNSSLTEETAFVTYDNFKAYMLPAYEMFMDTRIATSVNKTNGMNSMYRGDVWAGYVNRKNTRNPYAWNEVTETVDASGTVWDFSYIRRVNIMLANLDKANNLTQAEKEHWRAVGYFFHSFWYMELINRYGDVPYVEIVMDDASPERFNPREPRKEVADKVLEKLIWAEEHIGDFTGKDGSSSLTQNAVRAAISRFTLREATWRKYHQLGDDTKYFDACLKYSKLLMEAYPTLYTGVDGQPAAGYGEMWTTEDLKNVPGVILFQEFKDGYKTHDYSNLEHTASMNFELTQQVIDMYLCKDGKSINNSDLYAGDKDMYATFRNRDPRLYHVVMPPYKVKKMDKGGDFKTWSYTDNEADQEYLKIMGLNESCANPGVGMKRLPAQNWSATVLAQVPNFAYGTASQGFVNSNSGYYLWKNFSAWELNNNNQTLNTSDKPVFKVEEAILNYAEAAFEKGIFNQAVADESINRLRARAGVAAMNVADIDDAFDPNRGTDDNGVKIDPVLWEIRRERTIELMGEGFGFDDLRRWKTCKWFIMNQPKGMWATRSQLKASVGFVDPATHLKNTTMTEGYIFLWDDASKMSNWNDKYYLWQVPTKEILLNNNLTQNPGWTDPLGRQ